MNEMSRVIMLSPFYWGPKLRRQMSQKDWSNKAEWQPVLPTLEAVV